MITAKECLKRKFMLGEIWVNASVWEQIPSQQLGLVQNLLRKEDSESEEDGDKEELESEEGEEEYKGGEVLKDMDQQDGANEDDEDEGEGGSTHTSNKDKRPI